MYAHPTNVRYTFKKIPELENRSSLYHLLKLLNGSIFNVEKYVIEYSICIVYAVK